jgi:hypothetical protein
LSTARVVRRQLRQSALHANELTARVAALVEPVGIDEPRAVIPGASPDALKKRKLLSAYYRAHKAGGRS